MSLDQGNEAPTARELRARLLAAPSVGHCEAPDARGQPLWREAPLIGAVGLLVGVDLTPSAVVMSGERGDAGRTMRAEAPRGALIACRFRSPDNQEPIDFDMHGDRLRRAAHERNAKAQAPKPAKPTAARRAHLRVIRGGAP